MPQWKVLYTSEEARECSSDNIYHYLREASALFARSTLPGNTRASDSGTSNKDGSHAFFVFIHTDKGSSRTKTFLDEENTII